MDMYINKHNSIKVSILHNPPSPAHTQRYNKILKTMVPDDGSTSTS
jgi:hypothetical protein